MFSVWFPWILLDWREFEIRPCVRRNYPNFSFFASFGIVRFLKLGNFSEISSLFKLAKILRKFCENSLGKSSEIIFCFWVKKPCFGVKVQITGSKTGVSKHCKFTENSEFVLFQTFRKLRKNYVKIEFRKSRKTRSDSKTDSNVRFKVQNAGP